MMKSLLAALALAAAALPGAADAATFAYRFSFAQLGWAGLPTGDVYSVEGRLTAEQTSAIGYDVTGATGTFSSNFNPSLGQVEGVAPGFPFGLGPSFAFADDRLLAFTGAFFGDGRFLSVDYLLIGGFGNGVESFGPLTEASLTAVAGVPEPATWALMIAGFGAVGAAMRRRRAAGSLAAA